MFEDLRSFIDSLKAQNEIIEINEELSVRYEVAGTIKFIAEKYGSGTFFSKVMGYDNYIVGNLLGKKDGWPLPWVLRREIWRRSILRGGKIP